MAVLKVGIWVLWVSAVSGTALSFAQDLVTEASPPKIRDRADLIQLADTILQDDFRAGSFYLPEDNAEGLIGWGESQRLQGILTLFEITQDYKYLDQFKRLSHYLLSRRDDALERVDALRGRIIKGWGSSKYTNGEWHNFGVQNALIAEQYARYARLTAAFPEYDAEAPDYLATAIEMVREYDADWKPAVDFDFYYFTPGSHHSHTRMPWNQGLGIGLALIEIGRAERALGSPVSFDLRRKTRSMAESFKRKLIWDSVADSYSWEYSEIIGLEDVNHAILDIRFAFEMNQEGRVFSDHDMRRFANAYTRKFREESGMLTPYVDGRTLGYPLLKSFPCMRLSMLAQFDPKVVEYCAQDVDAELSVERLKELREIVYFVSGLPEMIKWSPKP